MADSAMAETWEIDLRRKLARSKTGLVVHVTRDSLYPGKWIARRSNALHWAQGDYLTRSPIISRMVQAALSAYEAAHQDRHKK